MKRIAISYLGIALLLWIGIVIPTAQQVAPEYAYAGSAEHVVGNSHKAEAVPVESVKRYVEAKHCTADPDLSDVAISLCPSVVSSVVFRGLVPWPVNGLTSHLQSPQDRPPRA